MSVIYLSLFLIIHYLDITIDTKNRILLLSDDKNEIHIAGDTNDIILDSIFNPTALTGSPFSLWVASKTQSKTQKYSLKGEYLGSFYIKGYDIDANENEILIAGDNTFLIEFINNRKLPIFWKETRICALGYDSIYLYCIDTLYTFKKPNNLITKKYLPGIGDLTVFKEKLAILYSDSLVMNDTTIYIPGCRRFDSDNSNIWILTDSTIVRYP